MAGTAIKPTDAWGELSQFASKLPMRRSHPLRALILLAFVLLIDFVSYERIQPFAPDARFTAWIPIGLIIAVGVAGIAILERDSLIFTRQVASTRAVIILVTLIAAGSLVYSSWGVPSYLQYSPSPAATQAAAMVLRTLTKGSQCVIVRHDTTDLLPTPYQRCAWSGPGGSVQVDYLVNWNQGLTTPSEYGFSYSPGDEPGEPDTCVEHVEGAWWAVMGESSDDPSNPCPFSFQFQGAP
jgi:hypothetical protein